MENSALVLNEDKKRFELVVDGHIAFIEYIISNDQTMFLTHTEVPKALGGKGIGSKLVNLVFEYIKENNYTLAPLCPFVAKYLTKNLQWKEILAKGYNV